MSLWVAGLWVRFYTIPVCTIHRKKISSNHPSGAIRHTGCTVSGQTSTPPTWRTSTPNGVNPCRPFPARSAGNPGTIQNTVPMQGIWDFRNLFNGKRSGLHAGAFWFMGTGCVNTCRQCIDPILTKSDLHIHCRRRLRLDYDLRAIQFKQLLHISQGI